jgi:hypothetical protein
MSGLISPLLWQTVPFADVDAWSDFLGQHALWHEALGKATGTAYHPLDLQIQGSGPNAETAQKLTRAGLGLNQQMHHDIADALGVSRSGDLVSYTLSDRDQFVGWSWVHALDHERLRQLAGL